MLLFPSNGHPCALRSGTGARLLFLPSMPTERPPSSEPTPPDAPSSDGPAWRQWLKRLGVAGFLFFFIKGLLWLIVPALLVTLGIQCS